MRKLILIAAIATMSTTPCFANLSLASSEPSQAASAQPQSPAASEPQQPQALIEPQSPAVSKPQQSRGPEARSATVAKAQNVARHHRSHISGWATPVRGFYDHCM
jgi:hypothetical protein